MYSIALKAISPIDGRYASRTAGLIPFFSEEALIQYRVRVEIEYFIALVELELPQFKDFDPRLFSELRGIYTKFSSEDAVKSAEEKVQKTTDTYIAEVEKTLSKKESEIMTI